VQAAAYEGSRRAIRIDGTEVQARNVCEEILDARNIEDYQVSFPLGDPDNAVRGQDIAVEISASSARNSPIGGHFLGERRVTVRTTMVKE
jgi:hypothetical protein